MSISGVISALAGAALVQITFFSSLNMGRGIACQCVDSFLHTQ
ncbi:Man(5)GlcNAc(2)-PP-Dol alpha-1,3-mannosyltransferase -like protein [Gossypium arboreum]|uniref:Man(5)GlcNAc(2)-PP-Dol alpha-1,3-mannosyltransferase-like protein n=1 Tax=Gossypium arboreum TaxID=29729 RepID=A0A0B0PUS1_GOSAR|nr:Man(5)GlcNAc(2)-PP-Dol alpha-1,3-mannosyltransferase -like protein [Gossypium arboreum]